MNSITVNFKINFSPGNFYAKTSISGRNQEYKEQKDKRKENRNFKR